MQPLSSLLYDKTPLIAFNDVTQAIHHFLGKTVEVNKTSPGVEKKVKKEPLHFHLCQFMSHFGKNLPALPNFERLLVRKWSNFTQLCQSFGDTAFSQLTNADLSYLLFEEGLCMGTDVDYLSQFFRTRSPLKSIPYPVKSAHNDVNSSVKFYPFTIDIETLAAQTQSFRFLHAAYKIAYSCKKGDTDRLEFVPSNILRKKELKVVKRIPDPKIQKKFAFKIENLLPELNKLTSQNANPNTGYILLIGGPNVHALTLYLQAPYHFVDPSNGIAIANTQEDLVLFLANYLTEKFQAYQAFSLVEISARNQNR